MIPWIFSQTNMMQAMSDLGSQAIAHNLYVDGSMYQDFRAKHIKHHQMFMGFFLGEVFTAESEMSMVYFCTMNSYGEPGDPCGREKGYHGTCMFQLLKLLILKGSLFIRSTFKRIAWRTDQDFKRLQRNENNRCTTGKVDERPEIMNIFDIF